MKMSLAAETESLRSDNSMKLVGHIENIRRHKPEITTELFDKKYCARSSTKIIS